MYSLPSDPLNCIEYCGDGIRLTADIECDDGNFKNGDGCSTECKTEDHWFCVGGNSTHKDVCSKDNIRFDASISSNQVIYKNEDKNEEVYLELRFEENFTMPAGFTL